MIQLPSMYTTRFGIDPGEQKLLDMAFEVLRRGKCFHPGQDTLARWLNRGVRQVQRYLKHLAALELMTWVRRGKKLTNRYHLGAALWRTLMKGRKIPGVPVQRKEAGPVDRETAKRLLHEIVASIPGAG